MQYFLQLLVIGISIGFLYALIALGISLIYTGLDIVHFAHGEFYTIGGFVAVFLYTSMGMPFALAMIGAMLALAALGILVERVFYRPLTYGGGGYTVAGMGMVISGFGMGLTLQNIAILIWGALPRELPVRLGPPVTILDVQLPRTYLLVVAVSLFLMAVLHVFLSHTKQGRAMRAVAHNKDTAALMGINVSVMVSIVFGLGCALAAAGGVLAAPITFVAVQTGYLILTKGFASAVVGGFGSLPGAVAGGLIVGVVETLAGGYLSGSYKDVYAFALMIGVLIVRPSGFFGRHVKVKA